MAPDEKKKLFILLGLIGGLLVIVLIILQPWNSSSAPTTPTTGVATGPASAPDAMGAASGTPAGGSTPDMMAQMAGASGGDMPGGAMGGMDAMGGMAGAAPGGAPAAPVAKSPPKERYRVDPMAPFRRNQPLSSLPPVFTAARQPWTGQGVERLPQIRLADLNPAPRVPGERPANIPISDTAGDIEDGNKRLAGFMQTQSNMIWVIMEVAEDTGFKYYVLKPGDLVQVQGSSYQVVRFEKFQDKDEDNKTNVRVVLKDNETQAQRRVVLRPSPQPQDQTGGMGGMGGDAGMMGMPGMPGGMPGMPGGMPGMPGGMPGGRGPLGG
jgi:hypothetical protein